MRTASLAPWRPAPGGRLGGQHEAAEGSAGQAALRLARARRLLASGDATLEDIAARLGYKLVGHRLELLGVPVKKF